MTSQRRETSPVALFAQVVAFAAFMAIGAMPASAQNNAKTAAPQSSDTTTAEVKQPDWEKVCGTIKNQQECHISRKRIAATGQAIAQFLIIERQDKKLLQVAVPPVTLIQPGVQVKIDDGDPTRVQYVVCTPGECLALGEINADFISKLKKGGNVVITMVNPQGKPVAFDISLVGFTAAYDGPGIDPQQAQAKQKKLEDELKKKADEARQKLMKLQQQQSSSQ